MEIITMNGNGIQKKTAAAIGFFDGVHRAHRRLIEQMITIAEQKGLEKAVITFDKHPKNVLFGIDYYYITPLQRKLEKLAAFDIDKVYLIEFDQKKASMEPRRFIERYLDHLDTLVCGFDFTFGLRASGNTETLEKFGRFDTVVVEKQTHEGHKIGSTHIRDLIRGGRVDEVVETLGEYYRIRGEVIHGSKQGRTIDYPTANIDVGEYLIPKKGVYATMSKVKNTWYKSMSSVGVNPTLSEGTTISVESYLFEFDDTIYGEVIDTVFIKRLRDEKKFDSKEALARQIDKDGEATLAILKEMRIDGGIA